MSKTKINDPGAHHAGSGALIRRFLPYLAKYKMTLFLDLFCAALTTLCDIVLPKIMSTITNSAMGVGITLTAGIVLKLAALYFVLRIIDGAASYYMSSIGHIMGVHIETDMRRDAFDHLLKLDHTYYNNTKVGTIMGRITNDLFDVTEFAHHCPEEFFTLIMRRFMMEIAQRIAKGDGCGALITGENLGQVASQTMEAMTVIGAVVDIPIFMPLVGMDKKDIISIAREIGTLDTSILPYEDCCTVFTPKHPKTKPTLGQVVNAEKKLDREALIARALENVEKIKVTYHDEPLL